MTTLETTLLIITFSSILSNIFVFIIMKQKQQNIKDLTAMISNSETDTLNLFNNVNNTIDRVLQTDQNKNLFILNEMISIRKILEKNLEKNK